MVRQYVDIPIIYTVIDKSRELQPYIEAGVNIFNVSGGKNTVELVKWVREQYPDIPIIASGGKSDKSIGDTINAGANVITYTAYDMMEQYFHEKWKPIAFRKEMNMQPSNTEFDYVLSDANDTLEFIRALRRVSNSHTGASSTNQQPRLLLDEWGNIPHISTIAREYNRYLSRHVTVLAGTRGGKGIATPMASIYKQESDVLDYDMI